MRGQRADGNSSSGGDSKGAAGRPRRRRQPKEESEAGFESIGSPAKEVEAPPPGPVPTQSIFEFVGSIPQYIPVVNWLLSSSKNDTYANEQQHIGPMDQKGDKRNSAPLGLFGMGGLSASESITTFEQYMRYCKSMNEPPTGFTTKLSNPYVYFYAAHYVYKNERFMKGAGEDLRTRLYGCRQQVIHGPSTESQPACLIFSSEESRRWQAWKNLGPSCSRTAAMRQFLRTIKEADPNFQSTLVPGTHEVMSKQLTLLQIMERDTLDRFSKLVTQRKLLRFLESLRLIQMHIVKVQTAARRFLAKHRVIRMFNQRFTKSDTKELKALLKAGIPVLKVPYNGGNPSQRRLWLDDPDDDAKTSRLCITQMHSAPGVTLSGGDSGKASAAKASVKGALGSLTGMMAKLTKTADKASGGARKSNKGIYLADVAEVRPNGSSFSFKLTSLTDELVKNLPLSIVAAERTIDILLMPASLPEGKTREWFSRSLSALADEALTDNELSARGYIRGSRAAGALGTKASPSDTDAATAAQMQKLLEKGFNVTTVNESGEKVTRAVWFLQRTRRLSMGPRAGDKDKGAVRSLHVNDVSEVRPGCMREAALGVLSPADAAATVETMISIIGTENSLVFLVDNKQIRNLLCRRLQLFIVINRDTSGSDL